MKKLLLVLITWLLISGTSFWLTPQEEYVDTYITNALSKHSQEKKTSILRNAETKLQVLVNSIPWKDTKKPILELILNVVKFQLQWIKTNTSISVEASTLEVEVVNSDEEVLNSSAEKTNSNTSELLNNTQNELLSLINKIRQENGVQALTVNITLQTIAQNHVDEMNEYNYFNHTNLAWDDSVARVEKSWYTFTYVGETLAFNADTADVVAYGRLWSTQGHKEILLNSKATEIWIWYNSSKWIWTAVYANPINFNVPTLK